MKFGGGLGLRCLPLQDDLHYPSSDNHGSGENGCISSNVGHTNSGLEMLRDDNLQANSAGAHTKHILLKGGLVIITSAAYVKWLSVWFVHLGMAYISLSIQSLCNRLGTKSTPHHGCTKKRSQISCNPLLPLIIYYQHPVIFVVHGPGSETYHPAKLRGPASMEFWKMAGFGHDVTLVTEEHLEAIFWSHQNLHSSARNLDDERVFLGQLVTPCSSKKPIPNI